MNKVTQYIEKKKKWSKELTLLRELLQQSELVEDFKWKVPTYTLQGKNVIGIAGFKNYVGLWFFQGVFLKDEKKLLVNAQENKTKGLRQLRFNCLAEIDKTILCVTVIICVHLVNFIAQLGYDCLVGGTATISAGCTSTWMRMRKLLLL